MINIRNFLSNVVHATANVRILDIHTQRTRSPAMHEVKHQLFRTQTRMARFPLHEKFLQIAESIPIRVTVRAILPCGIQCVELVLHFPSIRQPIAVGIGIVGVRSQKIFLMVG